MSFVTGVDFIALQVQDHDRAAKFYGETLGLPFVKQWGKMPASEYQAGNLTLAVMQSDAFGLEFSRAARWSRCRSTMSPRSRSGSREPASSSAATSWTQASATRRSSHDPDGNLLGLHHRYAPKD